MDPSRLLPGASADSRQDELDFPSSAFRGDDGSISWLNTSMEDREEFRTFLNERYGVTNHYYCEPFLLLTCTPSIPHATDRPFIIAGFIAIWRDQSPILDVQFGFIGREGEEEFADWRDERPVESMVDPDILNHCHENEVPDHDFCVYLATRVFSNCMAISWISPRRLVVELPRTDDSTFTERLEDLPGWIEDMPYFLEFHNGPLHNTGNRGRRRDLYQPQPDDDGDDDAGEETFRYSDVFTLKSCKDVNVLDEFLLFSSATGRQKLKAVGWRFQIGRRAGNGAYIDVKHLICATNDPTIYSNPLLRDQGGGAVLLRSLNWKYPGDPGEEDLEDGELCGILQFKDLPAVLAKDHLLFVDVFDPLVEH